MTFRQIYKMAMDKLGLKEGNRRDENIIKTAINNAYKELYSIAGRPIDIEYNEMQNNEIFLPSSTIDVINIYHSKLKYIPDNMYNVYDNKVVFSHHIEIDKDADEKITIRIMQEPRELVDDTDVPKIPIKAHMALVYYAMFAYNDNFQYLNRYNYYLEGLMPEHPSIDEETYEEIAWE